MAEDDLIQEGIGFLGAGVDTASSLIWPVIIGSLVIIMFILVWWILSYRHTVMIKILTRTGWYPFQDKAKSIKKDGNTYWQLRKRKTKVPIPPRDALTAIGKNFLGQEVFYAEAYYDDEIGYIWHVDEAKENLAEKIKYTKDGKNVIAHNATSPLTPQQRALFIHELRNSNRYLSKSPLDILREFATPIVLVFLVVLMLVFWEDIAKPAQEMQTQALEQQKVAAEITRDQAEISAQLARIMTEGGVTIEQRIPPDG